MHCAVRAVTEVLTVEVTKGLGIIWQLDLPDECVLYVIHRISRPPAAGVNLMAASGRKNKWLSVIKAVIAGSKTQ